MVTNYDIFTKDNLFCNLKYFVCSSVSKTSNSYYIESYYGFFVLSMSVALYMEIINVYGLV